MRDDDDDLIPLGDVSVLVKPDDYDAVVVAVKKVFKYRCWQQEFRFKLVNTAEEVYLRGWCALPQTKKGRLEEGSKLTRWTLVLAAFTKQAPSKVRLSQFTHFWFRVRVVTVTTDGRQQPIPVAAHWSRVDEILDVVGRLGPHQGAHA